MKIRKFLILYALFLGIAMNIRAQTLPALPLNPPGVGGTDLTLFVGPMLLFPILLEKLQEKNIKNEKISTNS